MIRKTLQHRLARLEDAARIHQPSPPNLFLRFVGRRPSIMDVSGRAECKGHEWRRATDETQERFQNRIINDLESLGNRPPFLVFLYG
jgi:hypothetical protein